MFGTLPSYGLFVRHARDLSVRDFDASTMAPDGRPPVVLTDVEGFASDRLSATRAAGPFFRLAGVRNLTVRGTPGLADVTRAAVSLGAHSAR